MPHDHDLPDTGHLELPDGTPCRHSTITLDTHEVYVIASRIRSVFVDEATGVTDFFLGEFALIYLQAFRQDGTLGPEKGWTITMPVCEVDMMALRESVPLTSSVGDDIAVGARLHRKIYDLLLTWAPQVALKLPDTLEDEPDGPSKRTVKARLTKAKKGGSL